MVERPEYVKQRMKKESAKKIEHQNFIEEVKESTKSLLLDNIREKAEEVSKSLEEILKDNKGLTSTQIYNLITNRSTSPIDIVTRKSYTPEELAFAFQIYKDMMAKINALVPYPPNKTTFCQLLGISTMTYNNYKQDPERMEIMQIIDDYIVGNMLTEAQLGHLEKITTIFTAKAQHGLIEAQAPVVVKHEKQTDIEAIKRKMGEFSKVIEADYDEKE